jgi:HK97 family phage major capsid protein/HK97 family phage prohead protease
MLRRAYSSIQIRSVDEEKRIITGMATTPTPDSYGDIVEPKGAQFALPLPLLNQHNHDEPIGHVTNAKVTSEGIEITAKMVQIAEPGSLKNRLDEAWQSIKSGLVRGLSIGFRPIEYNYMDDSGGIRFLKWVWLELSAVTIPANADASITAIKSADIAQRAASGQMRRGVAFNRAGVSATPPTPWEGTMKISEQIAAMIATRGAKVARMNAINETAVGASRSKNQEEGEEFKTLASEVQGIDDELVDLETLDKLNKSSATAITPESGTSADNATQTRGAQMPVVASGGAQQPARGGISFQRSMLPKGTGFTRFVMALARSQNNRYEAMRYAEETWGKEMPEVALVLKAAVAAGTTTDVDWASKLVAYQQLVGEFVDLLRPLTILGKFGTNGIPDLRHIPFNVRMTTQMTGGTYAWVGEGKGKPVGKLTIGEITLKWAKAAGIIVVTDELMRYSSPSVEAIVRNDMLKGMALFSDQQFIDPDFPAIANVSPASITYGATEINPTGTTATFFRADAATLFNTLFAAGIVPTTGVWIMSNRMATKFSMMRNSLGQKEFPDMTILGGMLEGFPVIASEAVDPHSGGEPIIFVNADDIYFADDGPVTIDASREASLQMDSAPDSPPTASTVLTSLWQNNLVALRAERYMNWAKRRNAAVAYIDNAQYK